MHRVALLSLLCFALAGCGGSGVRTDAFDYTDPAGSDRAEAQANVRAAIPATEAYYADNGTYAGVTMQRLRATYDTGIRDVRFVLANNQTYCVESSVGSATASKAGPAAPVLSGAC